MRFWRYLALCALLAIAPTAAWTADETASVKPETAALYRTAREQVDKLATTAAAKYASEIIEAARQSIAAAQKGLEAGNDKATRDGSERAVLQSRLSLAVADERMAAEKTDHAKKELAALEQRLNAILAGKGEQP